MVIGIMMLPAVAACFWAGETWGMIGVAFLIAIGATTQASCSPVMRICHPGRRSS
jgi:ABC-type Mn2+/Zn2+ transport system permease subunit